MNTRDARGLTFPEVKPQYARLIEALSDAKRHTEAQLLLSAELSQDHSVINYLRWSELIRHVFNRRTVALCSSYTVRTIDKFLNVESFLSSWRAEPLHLEYLQWQAALADPQSYLKTVDAVIVLLDNTLVDSQYGGNIADALHGLGSLLRGFRKKSHLPLFLGLIPSPPDSIDTPQPVVERSQLLTQLAVINGLFGELAASDPLTKLIDVSSALASKNSNWYNQAAMTASKIFVSDPGLPSLARLIARTVGPLFVPSKKVLITDLDNTLWGGVLSEVGPTALATGNTDLKRRFSKYQRFLLDLKSRGVILAIASKNNESEVLKTFNQRAGDLEVHLPDFTEIRINWNEKSRSILEIADALNVGLDSIVFIDDSELECNLVRQVLPAVATIHAPVDNMRIVETLISTRYFDSWITSSDDISRVNSYSISKARMIESEKWTDSKQFLESLGLQLFADHLNSSNQDRIHQLLLKTNQFHLSLERPTLGSIFDRTARGSQVYALSLRDRFGDYGIIGVMELERALDSLQIRNWAISCRAFGRSVEDACFTLARRIASDVGVSSIIAEYSEGPRNCIVKNHLVRLGFIEDNSNTQKTHFSYNINRSVGAEIHSGLELIILKGR